MSSSAPTAAGPSTTWGLSLASAQLAGDLDDRRETGSPTANRASSAKKLDDLSPLVLMKLGGALQAKIVASSRTAGRRVAVVANSDSMSVGDNRLEGLKVDMTVGDVWGARSVDGSAKLCPGRDRRASRLPTSGSWRGRARTRATSTSAASCAGSSSRRAGGCSAGSPTRLELASLSAEGHGRRIALAGPATLSYGDGGLDIQQSRARRRLRPRRGQRATPATGSTSRPQRPRFRSRPSISSRRASASRASSTARRRSAGRSDSPTGDWRLRLRQASAPQTSRRGSARTRRSRAPGGSPEGGRAST